MINVLMLHYDLLFYRVPFYNLLQEKLRETDKNLIIWAYSIQEEINLENINFELIDNLDVKIDFGNYKHILKERKVQTVINFLQPSQPDYYFYLKMIIYTYLKKIDLIYYGHGLNLEKIENKTLNLFYNSLHIFYKKIILYTPNEKKYIWKIHQNKIDVAYNTLCFDSHKLISDNSREEIRTELSLSKDSFVVLFSGRIEKRKDFKSLIEIFEEFQSQEIDNIELLLVGPGIEEEDKVTVKENPLIHYLGPIYNSTTMAKVFSASDIFCIPGHIGLGLVEAMYWGLPVLTKNVKHAPEIYYLENGVNGFVLEDDHQLLEKIKSLSLDENRDIMNFLSNNAKDTYSKKASPYRMLEGFVKALNLP